MILSEPVRMWVRGRHRDDLLDVMSSRRLFIIPPSANKNFLTHKAMSFAAIDFFNALKAAGVECVVFDFFGTKGSHEWGWNFITDIRRLDPLSEMKCDHGLMIKPEVLHWAKNTHGAPCDVPAVPLVRMNEQGDAARSLNGVLNPLSYETVQHRLRAGSAL